MYDGGCHGLQGGELLQENLVIVKDFTYQTMISVFLPKVPTFLVSKGLKFSKSFAL